MAVYLNGRKVGDYVNSYLLLDVGNFVKPGRNTLMARWSSSGSVGQVEVRYARHKNAFKNVVVLSADGHSPKSVTFDRPY